MARLEVVADREGVQVIIAGLHILRFAAESFQIRYEILIDN
jgi:thymidine kinase